MKPLKTMKIFKYYLLLIALAWIACSCVTQKQRDKILKDCPVNTITKIKDSITEKQVIKHDSIYIYKTGPIKYIENPCSLLCDSLGKLKPFYSESKHNGIKQSLETKGNLLIQKCDVDSLLQVNKILTKQIDHYHSKEKETQVHENCKLEHRTDRDGFTWYWFIITASLLAVWILIKIFKGYLKVWFPFLGKFL